MAGIGGGGSTHDVFGWGCAARSWKPLPYFRPKYTLFHTLFQTWLSKCIPCFSPCNMLRFPIYGLYGDVPLNRVWLLPPSLEQGLQISTPIYGTGTGSGTGSTNQYSHIWYSHIWGGGGVLPYMDYTGMCFSTGYGCCPRVWNRVYKSAFLSGTGYTFCHTDSGTWSGWLFATRFAVQMNIVAVPAWVPLYVHSRAVYDQKVNRVSRLGQGIYFQNFVWNREAKLCFFSVWNRVRFSGTQWHTPILNWGKTQGQAGNEIPAKPHLKISGLQLEKHRQNVSILIRELWNCQSASKWLRSKMKLATKRWTKVPTRPAS